MNYSVVPASEPLSQGDILDGCPILGLHRVTVPVDLNAPAQRFIARVIVLTQACDIANDKATRATVAVVHPAERAVAGGLLTARKIRDQVIRGQVYGWYFLPAGPDPVALPESVVDLRDLHTIAKPVLEQLIADGKRAARFVTPYREHMAQHFTITYGRIALPDPYETND